MKKILLLFSILLPLQKSYAQSDESILRQLLTQLVGVSGINSDTLYLEQNIQKTTFYQDSISMNQKTGMVIPQTTIDELKTNTKKYDREEVWDETMLNEKLTFNSRISNTDSNHFEPYIKCLSKIQLESLKNSHPEHDILSVSKIIYADDHQSAIFDFSYGKAGIGFFSFQSFFIRKIYGKWFLISNYHWAMS